jgi:hypothetical protein
MRRAASLPKPMAAARTRWSSLRHEVDRRDVPYPDRLFSLIEGVRLPSVDANGMGIGD